MQSKAGRMQPEQHALKRRYSFLLVHCRNEKHLLQITHFTPFFSFALQCPVSIYSSSCPFVLANVPRWPYSDKSALLNFAVFRTVAIHQYCLWCLHTAHIHCEKRAMFVGLWVDASFSLIANADEEKNQNSLYVFVLCVSHLPSIFTCWINERGCFCPSFAIHMCVDSSVHQPASEVYFASGSSWICPLCAWIRCFHSIFLVQEKWKNVEGQSARFVYTNIQTETTNRKMAQHLWIATKF